MEIFKFCYVALALWVSLKRQPSLGERNLGLISQWLMYQVINISLLFHMTSQNCFYNCYYVKVTLACNVPGHTFMEPSPSSRSLHTEIKDGIHQPKQQPVYQQWGTSSGKESDERDNAAHLNRGKPEGQCSAAPKTGKAAIGSPAMASWEQSSCCSNKDEHKPLLHIKTPLHGFHGYQNNYI